MRNHILLFGPPGSGKDTQGKILSKTLNIPLISSGDALRDEIANKTEIGLRFEKLIKNGLLVPDETMYEFFKTILGRYNLKEGFIFNGFPRTVAQARFLSDYLKSNGVAYDCVLYLNVKDIDIIKRISGRLICKNCGTVYNIYFNPPKNDMKCDKCGGDLYKRPDDEESVVKRRLDVYHHDTAPLIEYFSGADYFFEIDGSGNESQVTERLLGVIYDRP
jgi:adenylate kinase